MESLLSAGPTPSTFYNVPLNSVGSTNFNVDNFAFGFSPTYLTKVLKKTSFYPHLVDKGGGVD